MSPYPLRIIAGFIEPDGAALAARRLGPVYVCNLCGCGIRAYGWGQIMPSLIAAHRKQRHPTPEPPR